MIKKIEQERNVIISKKKNKKKKKKKKRERVKLNFLKNDVNLLKTSFIKDNFRTSFNLTFLNVTSSLKLSF